MNTCIGCNITITDSFVDESLLHFVKKHSVVDFKFLGHRYRMQFINRGFVDERILPVYKNTYYWLFHRIYCTIIKLPNIEYCLVFLVAKSDKIKHRPRKKLLYTSIQNIWFFCKQYNVSHKTKRIKKLIHFSRYRKHVDVSNVYYRWLRDVLTRRPRDLPRAACEHPDKKEGSHCYQRPSDVEITWCTLIVIGRDTGSVNKGTCHGGHASSYKCDPEENLSHRNECPPVQYYKMSASLLFGFISDLFRDHGYQYNIFFGLYIDIGGCWNRWKFFNHRGVLLQCQKVI